MPQIGDAPQRQKVDISNLTTVDRTAKKVPLAPVKAPRPSSVKDVGKSAQAFAQLFKVGGDIIKEYGEKARKEDFVNGQMMYQQGKTLAELEKANENVNTVEGFRAMQATTVAHNWFNQSLVDINDKDKTLSPDEYRTKLNEQFSNLLTGNQRADGIITALSADIMPKLAGKQLQAFSAYKEEQTYTSYRDMLVARSSTGDDISAAVDVSDSNPLVRGLTPERRKQALSQAIVIGLKSDSSALYEEVFKGDVDGEDTVKGVGFSAAQVSAITSAAKQYDNRMQSKFSADLESDVRDVRLKVQTGSLTYEEGVEAMQGIKKQYGKDDRFMLAAESIVERSSDMAAREAQAAAKKAAGKAEAERDRVTSDQMVDVRDVRLKVRAGELTFEEGIVEARKLQKQFNTSDKWVTAVASGFQGAADSYWIQTKNELKAAARVAEKAEVSKQRITRAVATDRVWELKKSEQRGAWKALDMQLTTEAQKKLAAGESQEDVDEWYTNKRLATMSRWQTVDEATAQQWSSTFAYNMTDTKGQVTDEAVAAFNQFRKFSTMNPLMADKYLLNQDAKDIAETAMILAEASMDADDALVQAKMIMERDVQPAQVREKITSPEFRTEITKAVKEAIDTFDPNVFTNMFGGNKSMFYDVWSSGIERATKDTSFTALLGRLAEAHVLRNPNISPEVAASEAMKDALAQSTYIMGSMVHTSGTTTVREDMGISATEPMVENQAMLEYLSQHGKKMFGDDFGDWTFMDDTGFSNVELLDPSTWLDWEAEPINNIRKAIRNVPDMYVQYDAATKVFMVAPFKDDGSVGNVRRVPAAAIGAQYMHNRRKAVERRSEALAKPTPVGFGGIR